MAVLCVVGLMLLCLHTVECACFYNIVCKPHWPIKGTHHFSKPMLMRVDEYLVSANLGFLITLERRMLLTSVSSSEVCGAGMSGLLLLRTLDWRSILPTVAAVARPMVLYRLSDEGIMLPEPENTHTIHSSLDIN